MDHAETSNTMQSPAVTGQADSPGLAHIRALAADVEPSGQLSAMTLWLSLLAALVLVATASLWWSIAH
jgi:hypothetical protein